MTAKWLKGEGQAMTISFNTDGGSSVGDIKVIEGQKIGELPVPTKDGYDFDGWYANGKKVTEDTVASKNMELTAKWSKQSESDNKPSDNNDNNSTAKYFTVSFNSNGGSKVKSQSVLSGKTASKPANPSRSGYTFAGWTLNGKTYSFSSKVTSNITLVASWTKNSTSTTSFTVTFNSNGGSKVASQTVQSGKLITKPSDPTRDGYKFVGWYIGSTLVNFKSYKVSSNVTLTAKWEQVTLTAVIEKVPNSQAGQILIFIMDGDKKVAGYADIVIGGQTYAGVYIPATGLESNSAEVTSVNNIKNVRLEK